MELMVTIGWTQYGFDGWEPGLRQHVEDIFIDIETAQPTSLLVETIVEAVFIATNHPEPESLRGMSGAVYRAIRDTGYRGEQAGHYSISVGDTVTIGETTWACERFGWKIVIPGAAQTA
jgi:hypothetical protein